MEIKYRASGGQVNVKWRSNVASGGSSGGQ